MYPECIIKLSGIPSVYVTGCHTDRPEVVPATRPAQHQSEVAFSRTILLLQCTQTIGIGIIMSTQNTEILLKENNYYTALIAHPATWHIITFYYITRGI